jgi:hypothetical protein
MKILATILFFFLAESVFCQFDNSLPALENVSRADIKLTEPLWPGRKIVFRQNCNPDLPDTVGNGIVQFENLRVVEDRVVASIEFKDTVVQRLIFEFKTSDKDALKYFGVPNEGFTELGRKMYYRSYIVGDFEFTCFVNQRKVTLIKAASRQ